MTRLVVRGSGSLAIRLKPPSDCPLLYVMPTRSTLRLSPAEQPTSISQPQPRYPARRLGNGRIQHGAAFGLAGFRLAAHGDGHDRVGHSQQRVGRRASGSVGVRSGIRRGKRRGASGEGEVVQRGQDHRGVPLARRRRLDRAQRLVGLTQATATRSYSGDVSAASTSPKRRYT
jgi:hypothetical protein